MIQEGKVTLDRMVFDQSSCAIDKKYLYGIVDSICRDSLRETLVAEQFTDILKDKFSKIIDDWEVVSKDVNALRSSLEEARDMLTLVSPSQGRSRQLQTGLLVSNKKACRQHVWTNVRVMMLPRKLCWALLLCLLLCSALLQSLLRGGLRPLLIRRTSPIN